MVYDIDLEVSQSVVKRKSNRIFFYTNGKSLIESKEEKGYTQKWKSEDLILWSRFTILHYEVF